MTLDEFRKHPAYNYYITTLVYNNLYDDLTDDFGCDCISYTETEEEYILKIINVNNLADEVEERIQFYLSLEDYKDLYYIRNDNEFYFYLKTYNDD